MKKLVELEALRGIAAIVVLIHHFMLGYTPRLHGLLYPDQPFSLMGTPAFALINGSAAVIIFFVLSGFVLTIGLIQKPDWKRSLVAILKRWPRLAGTVMLANLVAGTCMAFSLFDNANVSQLVPSIWLGWFYRWQSAGLIEMPSAVLEGATTFFTGLSSYNSNLWTMYYEFWGSMIAIGCATVLSCIASSRVQKIFLLVVWITTLGVSPYLSSFVIGVWLAKLHSENPTASWSTLPSVGLAIAAWLMLGYHENLLSGRPEYFYASLIALAATDPLIVRVVIHSMAAAITQLLFIRVQAIRQAMSGHVGRFLGLMSFPIYLVQIIVISSISAKVFAALPEAPHIIRVLTTLVVTIASTVLIAMPLAYFDVWWVQTLGRWAHGMTKHSQINVPGDAK